MENRQNDSLVLVVQCHLFLLITNVLICVREWGDQRVQIIPDVRSSIM